MGRINKVGKARPISEWNYGALRQNKLKHKL